MLTKTLFLYLLMIRYRVAAMLILFFLLGIASSGKILDFQLTYLLGVIILLSNYAGATSLNDIADEKIDKINHPHNPSRPLISGKASKKDLYYMHFLSLFISILCSFFIGATAFLITFLSLAINFIYSMPPLRFSYRTHFAHVLLAIAYVFLPFWLGVHVAHGTFTRQTILLLFALFFLFFGRIFLKDFRDRKGDAKYHKPTFLLSYGKTAVCLISFGAVLAGNILLVLFLLKYSFLITILFQLHFFAIYLTGIKLYKSTSAEMEQIAIGTGAKEGSSILIMLLGLFILQEYHASEVTTTLFIGIIALLGLGNFLLLQLKPGYAVLGYRG